MNHTSLGISNIEVGKEDTAAVADRRYIEVQELQAEQARHEFIQATIKFFGLEGFCVPSDHTLTSVL